MNWASRDSTLKSIFTSSWTVTDVSYEFWGEKYEPASGRAFIRPAIVGEASGQVAKGGAENFYRFLATLRIGLFAPIGTKASTVNAWLDTLATLFRAKTISGIGRFRVPTRIGPIRDGAWDAYHIEVDFYRDEHEAEP